MTASNIYASWTIFWTPTLFILKLKIEDLKTINFSFVFAFVCDNLWWKKSFTFGDWTYLIRYRVKNVTKMITAISTCPPTVKNPSEMKKRSERLLMILMIDFMLIIFFPASPVSDSTLATLSNQIWRKIS